MSAPSHRKGKRVLITSLGVEKMITLTVNGKAREASGPMSIERYLVDIGVTQKAIAVAHNGEVVPRTELGGITLRDGDQLEIVRAVGGG